MIIVIDAYNLLHAMPLYKKALTDKERGRFIKQLAQYGRNKGHKVVVVFDGGRFEWPQKEKIHAVQVVYSGIHATADDYIKEYLEKHQSNDLLLVSSDSELNDFAARFSIPSIDSVAFAHLVRQAFGSGAHARTHVDTVVKMAHDTNHDIDALMIEASKSVSVKAEDVAAAGKRDAKKKQVGKQERLLLKKLDKL